MGLTFFLNRLNAAKMDFRRVIFSAVLLFYSGVSFADRPPVESWTFTFHFENDLFAETDRFYTNGIKLSWVSPDLGWFRRLDWVKQDGPVQGGVKRLFDLLPFSDDKERRSNFTLSVGQKMFTPENIAEPALIVDERPYGGWLYGSGAFHSKTYRRLDTFELQIGFTGDWSLAGETQNFVHSIMGIDKANGWDNQIDTELGFAFIYDRKYRLIPRHDFHRRWGMDGIVHIGGAAGTVFSHFNTGIEVRIGWNIPADFGTALIRPAGDANGPAATRDSPYDESGEGLSFHLFGGTTGRVVLRDLFLDGNTYSRSHSIDKEILVAGFVLGASLGYKKLKLSYALVLRTKEFKSQSSGQNFGSISISYTY